jgi:hypothetical protein
VIRDKELPGLIEEQKELTLDSPACRQRAKKKKKVSLINKKSKLASRQAGQTSISVLWSW